jgi:hypothetical protein
MTRTTTQEPSGDCGLDLPRPHRGSRWRWSRPRHALAAGGILAAVLGFGAATGPAAGAATTASGHSAPSAHGRLSGGMARPAVSGKITALSGNEITVQTNAKVSVTVVFGSNTTFKANPGPSGGTMSRASALKVGDFVGVQGTKNTDDTVAATTVMIGRPQMGTGGPGGGTGRSGKPPSGAGGPPTA